MIVSEDMTARRERMTIQVFIVSLVVGLICFVLAFYLLLQIGLQAGFLKLILFAPPPDSKDWQEMAWWTVIWVGSFSVAVLLARTFFRYAKRFIPAK